MRSIRSSLSVLALAFVVVFAPACGPKLPPGAPPLDPVATVAVYGRQFTVAADGVVSAVDGLATDGVLPRPEAIAVLKVLERVGSESVRLADALKAIQAARAQERPAKFSAAFVVLSSISGMFDASIIPVKDPKARAVLIAVFAGARAVLVDVSNALKTAQTSGGNLELAPGAIEDLERGGRILEFTFGTWLEANAR